MGAVGGTEVGTGWVGGDLVAGAGVSVFGDSWVAESVGEAPLPTVQPAKKMRRATTEITYLRVIFPFRVSWYTNGRCYDAEVP